MNNKNKSIILFDGICNLCNYSVSFILKKDKKKHFRFASLQSDAAKKLLLHANNKNILNNLKSIVLISNNKVYTKSTAVLKIGKYLKFPYNLSYLLLIVPRFFRDFIYDYISKNRYKWFGKNETCMMPSKEYLDKFIV